jgi:hypothetical protein
MHWLKAVDYYEGTPFSSPEMGWQLRNTGRQRTCWYSEGLWRIRQYLFDLFVHSFKFFLPFPLLLSTSFLVIAVQLSILHWRPRYGVGGCYWIVCIEAFFQSPFQHCILKLFDSEITPEGIRTTKLDQILLNGNNICLVSFDILL